jgi:uncharacterized protein YbjT (DUF2867 family)
LTALTRKSGNATFPEGINAAAGNYSDKASLVIALKGHDSLVITLAFTPDMSKTCNKTVRAAAMAGV